MNTQIKLILRALLPLLFIGANRIGQHIARPHFIPDGAAVRAEVLFPAFLLFFFPIILLIHGCICYINQRHKFNLKRLAYALAILFILMSIPTFFLSDNPLSAKIWEASENLFGAVILWLYLYGMNTTRQVNVPEWNSKSGVAWFCISLCLIVGILIPSCLFHYGVIGSMPFRLYSPLILSYGWFGLIYASSR